MTKFVWLPVILARVYSPGSMSYAYISPAPAWTVVEVEEMKCQQDVALDIADQIRGKTTDLEDCLTP